MDLTIDALDEHEAYARVGSVVLRVIDGAVTDVDAIERIFGLIERVLEGSPHVGVWVVIHHGSPPPTMAVMRYSARRFNVHASASNMVYSMLGIGFWAGAARKATVILNKLLRSRSSIEDTVEAGAQRLGFELVGLNADELVAGYEAVRAKMLQARAGQIAEAASPPVAETSGPLPSASMSRVGERSMIRRFRIVAEHELCHGHGMCAAEAPELFRVVDDKVRIDDPEPDPKLWFKAEAATRYCPQFALTIEELDDA